MLGLRTRRITFGCPAGNIAGGYGINTAEICKGSGKGKQH